MSIRRPDGEPAGIELFGNDPVGEVASRVVPFRRRTWSEEALITAIGMMASGDSFSRKIGARLGVMAVEAAGGILPPGVRPTRRGS